MGSATKKTPKQKQKSLSLWEVSKQGKSMGLPSMESRRNSSAERWDGFGPFSAPFFFFGDMTRDCFIYITMGWGEGGGCLGMLAHIYIYITKPWKQTHINWKWMDPVIHFLLKNGVHVQGRTLDLGPVMPCNSHHQDDMKQFLGLGIPN